MKKIFFCLLLLFPLCIFSQNSIRGKITDEKTGEALVGATVFIPDLHTGASTDTSGRFIIHNVPGGSFLAEIHMTGYTAKAIVLSSNDSANYIVITLSQKPTEMRAVVITSPSGSTDRQTNPVPTVIAGRDHLLAGSSTNLVAGISNIPGISQVSTGSAVSKPVIRGLGYNRVVVLRDGIRQEGQQWGDEHGIEIDEFEVDRIEIIKGPGSIMYGSDAMAGVINFMTPKPVDDGKWSGEFMTNYQTNANLAGLSFSEAGNFHGVSWMTRYSQKKAGNFSTPVDGHVLNSGFDEYDASGFLGLNRKWGYSRISFSTFNQRIGMPEGDRDSLGIFTKEIRVDDSTTTLVSVPESARKGFDNSILTPFQRINHNRVVWDNAFYFAHSKLTLTGGWQQNRRREFGDVFSPDEAGLHFLLTTANLDVKYFFPAVRQWSITSGASGQFQQSSNLGTEFLIPAYSQYDAGAFVFASRHFGKLFFSGGARADMRLLNASALYLDANGNAVDATNSVMTKFDAFSKNFYAFSGSLGLSYHISGKSVLRVNLSKGFRAPNLAELGANGVHEGTFRYEKGNHALNPENSYQLDAGFSCDADHVSFELDGFYNRITQYIFLQKVNSVSGGDSIIDPADPVPLFTFVQGNAALYGGEVSLDIHPHPLDWLHFENSFSYVRGALFNQPDSMTNLPFMPPGKIQSELRAELPKAKGCFANAYVDVSGDYFLAQNFIYSAYGTETASPGYFLLGAGAGSDIINKKGKTVCRVFFAGSNLTNVAYQSHLNRLRYAPVNPVTGKPGIWNPGRNFSVKVVIPFDLK